MSCRVDLCKSGIKISLFCQSIWLVLSDQFRVIEATVAVKDKWFELLLLLGCDRFWMICSACYCELRLTMEKLLPAAWTWWMRGRCEIVELFISGSELPVLHCFYFWSLKFIINWIIHETLSTHSAGVRRCIIKRRIVLYISTICCYWEFKQMLIYSYRK